jgi:hypothetical protein
MTTRLRRILVVSICLVSLTGCPAGTAIEFPDLNERLLMTSDQARNPGNPFTPKDCPDCRFAIVNRSGKPWTGFHFEMRLGNQPDGTFGVMSEASGGFDGDVYEGPGADALSNNNHTLDVTGLNIADGSRYEFTVDVGDLEFQGIWHLYGRPTVEGK